MKRNKLLYFILGIVNFYSCFCSSAAFSQTASYAALKGGKTVLYIRSFDGSNFGPVREIGISSHDDIRGWSWDGKTVSYAALQGSKTVLYIRSFDGSNFGPVREIGISSSDDIRGWSWGLH